MVGPLITSIASYLIYDLLEPCVHLLWSLIIKHDVPPEIPLEKLNSCLPYFPCTFMCHLECIQIYLVLSNSFTLLYFYWLREERSTVEA
jgi:hypothetical protein